MKIRITGAQRETYWYADKIGEVFTVIRESSGGYDFIVAYREPGDYEDTDYYVSIEDCEIVTDEQSRKIDGRKAEIVDTGKHFSTYKGFAIKHGYPDAAAESDWEDDRRSPQEGDVVTLLVSGEHESMYKGDTLWVVEAANGERHIFNEKGLRILDEDITVLPDESLGGVLREYREVKRKAAVGERVKYADGRIARVIQDGDTMHALNETYLSTANNCQSVVLEPSDILVINGARYRMVDRKAAVGERVIVTNPERDAHLHGGYVPGDVATITCTDSDDYGTFYDAQMTNGKGVAVYAKEYRVLEPVESELSTRPATEQAAENIAALTTKIQTLETRLNALYDWHKRAAIDLRAAREDLVLIEEGVSDDIGPLKSRLAALEKEQFNTPKLAATPPQKTAQQIRDEIVERAKADVKALSSRAIVGVPCVNTGTTATDSPDFDEIDFVINRDKRKVTAIIRTRWSPKTWAVGRSKCAPNDVFNVHIGKAIALRRALGLEVPSEYLSAPNPEEVRVGDVVVGKISGVRSVVHRVGNGWVYGKYVDGGEMSTWRFRIIDDSRENNAADRKEVAA